ncbi:hypothetical protein DW624_RS05405 [Enterococcus hirae]
MFEELQKTLEKQLIRLIVATPSHVTSQNRKNLTKQTLQQKKQTLKQLTTSYASHLSHVSKGTWVKTAIQVIERTANQFEWLT